MKELSYAKVLKPFFKNSALRFLQNKSQERR